MKIAVIVVVYNKEVKQLVTCNNARLKDNIELIVVDNSTGEYVNKDYCEQNHIKYITMGGNAGLSKAYNAAIDALKNDKVEAIMLLDDDTDVPNIYFAELETQLESKLDVDIFVPIIKGQDRVIYSPNNYNFFRNELVNNPLSEVRQDSFNAISSCMAIRMKVFDHYRFNEKLFVDEIDHCFCREQRELGRVFGIIDVVIVQNFHQRQEKLEAVSAWKRVRLRIMDIFRHARLMGGRKYIFLAFVKCCGIGIQMGTKSGSLKVTLKALLLSSKLVFVDK